MKFTDDVLVWLKFDRSFFSLVNDIYAANVYIVPQTSVYLFHNIYMMYFGTIQEAFQTTNFLVCADYIAPTIILPDFIGEFPNGYNTDLPIINSANNLRSILI